MIEYYSMNVLITNNHYNIIKFSYVNLLRDIT